MSPTAKASTSEIIATCISREIRDGDVVGLGLGTFIPAAGAMLAHRTHAPMVDFFVSPVGAYVSDLPMLTLTLSEWAARARVIDRPMLSEVFGQEVHPNHVEFFRPAQMDAFGRFNTSLIGSWDAPKLRLPGAAGIPDVTATLSRLFYYVPRHDTRTLVETVDFITGGPTHFGAKRSTSAHADSRAFRLITDLGVFGFNDDGRMEVESLHENVTRDDVIERTGFSLNGKWDRRTVPPTNEELELLRESIDPLGVMSLETLPAKSRRERLLNIYKNERQVLEERTR
jgi:glutaconate CoA-transferase, subunit B